MCGIKFVTRSFKLFSYFPLIFLLMSLFRYFLITLSLRFGLVGLLVCCLVEHNNHTAKTLQLEFRGNGCNGLPKLRVLRRLISYFLEQQCRSCLIGFLLQSSSISCNHFECHRNSTWDHLFCLFPSVSPLQTEEIRFTSPHRSGKQIPVLMILRKHERNRTRRQPGSRLFDWISKKFQTISLRAYHQSNQY